MAGLTWIERIRILTIGDKADSSQDELLNVIRENAEKQLIQTVNRIGRKYSIPEFTMIPEDLGWILDDLVVRRFNRVGSLGISSESVSGHSVTYDDVGVDDYLSSLEDYLAGMAVDEDGSRSGSKIWIY